MTKTSSPFECTRAANILAMPMAADGRI